MNISDMTIFNLNIKSSELIEATHQDFRSTLIRNDTIKFMMIIEIINLDFFRRIIRIIRTIQTRFLQLLFLSIQARKSRIRMILTELRDHFSIQNNSQTTMNINLDLIQSKILHSEMIHILLRRYVRIELRNLHSHLDRMNSIEETTNTKARFIMRK